MGCWYNKDYDKNNITVSTRIRLARNLTSLPFPSKMNDEQYIKLCETVKSAVDGIKDDKYSDLKFIYMKDIPKNERFALFERHIISKDFATNFSNRAIIISKDESVAIMIGEEDHIRIQVIKGGFCPKEAYEIANNIDDELSRRLDIAFNSDLGFLTGCPTNLGTGLRASVMLHLPFTESADKIPELVESLSKIGFTIRGMYGESSKALSSFYQISNQITLGITEENAINNLTSLTNQIIDLEKLLRENSDRLFIEDKAFRALYILKGARILESNEMMNLLSDVMVGINLGVINQNSVKPVKTLIECSPYMLMSKKGDISPNERDALRAKIVSESINL